MAGLILLLQALMMSSLTRGRENSVRVAVHGHTRWTEGAFYDPNGRASQLIHLKMIDFCIETQSQLIHLKMPMIYLCIEIQLVTVAP